MAQGRDWYKKKLSELDSWHTAYAAQCAATGTIHGLSAGAVTQAGADAQMVSLLVDFDEQIRGYLQAWTEYRDAILRGDPNAPMPVLPTPPTLALPPLVTFMPGIEARTRGDANIIKADPDYTQAVGEDYGIVAPVGTGPVTPSLRATAIAGTSHVSLAIAKGGYAVVAIDRRLAGGVFAQIGVSQTATFVDTTPPSVPGQPEVVEYRAQGMVSNQRVGDLSPTVSVVTVP